MDTLRTILDVALRVVAFASIPCVIAAAVAQVRILGRERPFERHRHVVGMVVSAGFLVLYTLVLRVTPVHWLSWPLLAGGALLGLLIGRMMLVDRRGAAIVMATGWWSLIVWTVAFAVTQTMVVFSSTDLVALGLSAIFFSTGLTLGQDGMLLQRATRLGAPAADASALPYQAPAGDQPPYAPAPGVTPTPYSPTYPDRPPYLLVAPSHGPPPGPPTVEPQPVPYPGAACPGCGAPLDPGQRFCIHCGTQVA